MYKLVSELGGVTVFQGSKVECENTLEAFKKYGIREDKLEIVPLYPDKECLTLSEDIRNKLKIELVDCMRDCLFGDGSERDYCWDGTTIVGVNDMSDVELVEELVNYSSEMSDLIKTCLSELGSDALIKGVQMPNIDVSALDEEDPQDPQLRALIALRNQFSAGSDNYAEISLHIDKRKALLSVVPSV